MAYRTRREVDFVFLFSPPTLLVVCAAPPRPKVHLRVQLRSHDHQLHRLWANSVVAAAAAAAAAASTTAFLGQQQHKFDKNEDGLSILFGSVLNTGPMS